MDYRDLKQVIDDYANRDLEQRRTWYSPAAAAYQKVRPRYSQALIQQVVEITQLSPDAKILEVGCGPATATADFAEMGFEMVCLEPNPEFCRLAQQTCNAYPNVDLLNTSFEEWPLEVGQFDAVLAASSCKDSVKSSRTPASLSILYRGLWNLLRAKSPLQNRMNFGRSPFPNLTPYTRSTVTQSRVLEM